MTPHPTLLVDNAQAAIILSIPPDDLDWLVSTQQLFPIHIRGRRLFEITQLEELIQTYQSVQSRGNP